MANGAPPTGAAANTLCFVLRPNRSLSIHGMWILFLVVALCVVGIGLSFLSAGVWTVLPFAGLEVLLVGGVLCLLCRHVNDREVIDIDGDRLIVVKHNAGCETRHEFQRCWARVILERAAARRYPSRLWICAHGRRVEVATAIDEKARQGLARELKQVVGAAY